MEIHRARLVSLQTRLTPRITHGKGVILTIKTSGLIIKSILHLRCSSVCAYYIDRPNFKVLTNSTVTRILWNRSSLNSSTPLRARAVEFRTPDGHTHEIHVGKEVILSAGAIGSPKILELSGVGNST